MRCPSCRLSFDPGFLAKVAEGDLHCPCGAVFTPAERAALARESERPVVSVATTAELRRRIADARARRGQRELGALVDRLCLLIVSSDLPDVDLAIERDKVRARAEELFPDRMDLYEMVYESRFERLLAQFREPWR